MDAPMPPELLNVVDIFSPNESELARLTCMSTESFEQIGQAVVKCHKMVSLETPIIKCFVCIRYEVKIFEERCLEGNFLRLTC
jgi:pyridoxal/pyridoxine/pyridoxamine kinase